MQINAAAAVTPNATVPRFTGGIQFTGTGRYTAFAATATSVAAGAPEGYGSLQQAIDAITMETVGAHIGAAGIFERDGRFFGRELKNTLTFGDSGASWTGKWRLEQYPADAKELFGDKATGTTRVKSLQAIVDGAQRVDLSAVPIAVKTPKAPKTAPKG
ncbi:MAG: hypothetical protein JWM25_546 [Thermoleophilia bacterium]|nr:hypothetical protein [Thermoleophilia bacterium]MCZ4495963.1 hypothetical protein [Thermoleophilia bacterium]